ncbi:DUF3710 domain-containing protein [Lacisediminihabitans sp. H27-G8]|uniref:DUF3710 domain-containing protein n=1 Tax=Lacisediminihabitans sp. H27-G8 TaxID=3111909 RepID=UPI0038FCE8AF
MQPSDVTEASAPDEQLKSAPADRETEGPLDESEANPVRPYVDLGGVKILPREGLQLRLEVEEGSQRVVAVGLDYAGSTLQVQPFAAPRTSGLWHEIRDQIAEQIAKQGGTTRLSVGPFGPELLAEIPATTPGQPDSTRLARFIGVDGPRWFLRGVIAGDGAVDQEAASKIEELFRSVVVVRGKTPMPPRDLIPLHMPKTAAPADDMPSTPGV